MAQTTISIRMDGELKQSFERLCRDIGMNASTGFTIFAKQSIRENRLPLSLSVDPFYSKENLSFLREGAAALDAGMGVKHGLIEAEP